MASDNSTKCALCNIGEVRDALRALLGAYQHELMKRGEVRDIFTRKAIKALDKRLDPGTVKDKK